MYATPLRKDPRVLMTSMRLSAAAAALAAAVVAVGATDALAAPPTTATFPYTGAEQTYTVPAGTHLVRVTAVGGKGGRSTYTSDYDVLFNGGFGGRVSATLSVTPGQKLYVNVGDNGTN